MLLFVPNLVWHWKYKNVLGGSFFSTPSKILVIIYSYDFCFSVMFLFFGVILCHFVVFYLSLFDTIYFFIFWFIFDFYICVFLFDYIILNDFLRGLNRHNSMKTTQLHYQPPEIHFFTVF